MGAGVVVGANVVVSFAANAEVVLFAASACVTHRSRRMCRAMLASQCWLLPRSESGAAFAGRAHHAAAALLPPITSIYIGAGAAYTQQWAWAAPCAAPPCGVEPSFGELC